MEKHSQISVAGTYQLTPQDHVWGNSPLHSACYHGKLDTVQLLILEQPSLDINVRNHRGDSPLTLACQAGHLDVIHFLLTLSSCDITHTNKAGDTPLHVACSEGHTAAVKVLCSLDKCAMDGRNRHGNSPLALACRGGHLDVIKFLVESMHSSTSTLNKDGDTPLLVACSHGNSQVVEFLVLISDSDINLKNTEGNTPLHLACQNGWKHIVEFVMNKSNHVNINQPNNDDDTPLHVAILLHQKDVADLLSHHPKCNTKVTNKDGNMPLHLVCMEGWTDIVQYLLDTRGNVVNAPNIKGNTPLHISCLKGHTDVVKIIITQIFCDINCKNERGNTPLHLACLEGKSGIVRLLIDMKQCDLNLKNKAGICALHLAFYNRHQSVVEVLIRHDRCDVNCTDAVENTPLGLAANLSWTDVVKFLITEKQCNINHQNRFGDTPLHLSKCVSVAELLKCDVNCKNSRGDTALSIACQCNLDLVKFLIEVKHCKVQIQNEEGDSPLHHACRHGKLSIVEYLLSKQLLAVNCENTTGNTPLCVAAGTVYNDVVQFLVEIDDCDVNHQNKNGDTSLHIACRTGDICVVRALTDFRNKKVSCNFNIKNNRQETPALIVFRNRYSDIFRLLVTVHSYENLFSVLESISKDLWPEVVKLLTSDGAITVSPQFESQFDVIYFLFKERVWNLNNVNCHGNTPLHIACLAGDLNVVRTITSFANCHCNIQNKHGNTPLCVAAGTVHSDVVQFLVEIDDCDMNHQNENGDTPLHIACLAGDLNVVRTITSFANCHCNIQNKHGNTPLCVAAGTVHSDVVQFLVEIDDYDVNHQNKNGDTPLHIACRIGDIRVVRALTDFRNRKVRCNFNVKNKRRETPALIAFKKHHNDIFRLLVTEHHSACECLLSVLEKLTKDQWSEAVGILIADKNVTIPSFESKLKVISFLADNQTKHGSTLLHFLCQYSENPVLLISAHEVDREVNCCNDAGNTPLHLACLVGNVNGVQFLTNITDCRTNVNNNQQETPALIAFKNRHSVIFRLLVTAHSYDKLFSILDSINKDLWPEVVKLLTSDGAITVFPQFESQFDVIHFLFKERVWNLNDFNYHGNTPLHIACLAGDLNVVRTITSFANCHCNIQNKHGNTALSLACQSNLDLVKFLIETKHCKVQIQNKDGDSPLHHACRHGKLSVVKYLVNSQLLPENCENNTGNTPLCVAAGTVHREVVQFLVEIDDCDMNHQNENGDTPLHIACLVGDLNVVRTITSFANCHCSIQNKHGNTPLCVAAGTAYNEVVQFLVEIDDCDVNHQNKNGDTPLHIACRIGDIRVVRALTDFRNRKVRCDFNVENKQQETPALIAFKKHHNDIFRLLVTEHHSACLFSVLERVGPFQWSEIVGILIADKNVNGKAITVPLFFGRKLEIIRFLAEKMIWNVDNPIKHRNTLLHFLCQYSENPSLCIDEHDAVKEVNCCNKAGNTPLHLACLAENVSAVQFLTNITDCKTNVKNDQQETPAFIAFRNRHSVIFRLLVTAHSYINLFSVLESISKDLWPEVVKLLTIDGAITVSPQFESQFDVIYFLFKERVWNLNNVNCHGNTPLHIACLAGDLNVVRTITSFANCHCNIQNKHGNTPLCVAAGTVHSDVVQFLVEIDDCDMNHQNENGDTPLHIACLAGDLNVVRTITSFANCHCNIQNKHGNTPLCVAAGTVHSDVVQFLVEIDDYDVNHQNKNGDTPLHIACRIGDIRVVRALTDFRNRKVRCNFNVKNKRRETPALIAFKKHHNDIFRLLVTEHHSACECLLSVLEKLTKDQWSEAVGILIADKNVTIPSFESKLKVISFLADNQTKHGSTLLHFLCQYSENPVLLISAHEVDREVNCCNDAGNTPLHLACLVGNVNGVQFLTNITDCRTNVNNNQQETPALIAFKNRHSAIFRLLVTAHSYDKLFSILDSINKDLWPEVVKLLTSDGAITVFPQFESQFDVIHFLFKERVWNLNDFNYHGNTPLHIACLAGDLNVVRTITSFANCHCNIQNKHGNTALSLACQSNLDLVKFLIETKHCKVQIQNKDGDSPLHHACRHGKLSVVKYLVNSQLLPENCENNTGNTPLCVAAGTVHREVVQFLVEIDDCDMNHQNENGDTPLHIACLVGDLNVVRTITSFANCHCSIQNKHGNTPLCVAAGTAYNEVVQFLVEIDDCDVNHQNKNGDTPLHIACRIGDIRVVRALTDFRNRKVRCDFNVENKQQETPALIAFKKHHNDIFRLLVTEHHSACLFSVLERVGPFQWSEIVGILIADKNVNGKAITVPLFFGRKLEIIRFLAEKMIWNVDNPIKHRNTLLHFLCQYSENPSLCIDEHDAVKEVNCCNKAGNTPLHLACLAENVSAVQFLTNITDCKTNVKNDQQETPAFIAFRNRHSVIFRLLVTAHSYINLFSVLESISKDLWPEVVKLLTIDGAITVSPQFESQFDVIHFLFNERVWDLNVLDCHGNTPLHIACLAGDLNVVRTIISFAKCRYNIQNKHGNTALCIACQCNLELVMFLIETKHCQVQIRNKDGDSPLHHACRLGKLSIVKYLVNEQLLPVNCVNNTGNTPLCVAVEAVEIGVVQFLVEIDDCDVNYQNKNGDTPLHIACRIGDTCVVRALTDFRNRKVSCNFNVKNNRQATPALIAYKKHHSDIFRLLVTEDHCECLLSVLNRIKRNRWSEAVGILITGKYGSKDVTMPSFSGSALKVISFLAEEKIWNMYDPIKHGNTFLHFLCQYSENLTLFIDKDNAVKVVNCCNNAGNTPLHLACLAGNVNAVQFLTNIPDCKADVKNNQQETPALIVFRNRYSDIFRLLVTVHSYENLFSVLESISEDLWPEVVKLLTSDGAITVSPQFESQFDVIYFLFKERVWNLNNVNCHGNTPLHIACLAGDLNVVRTITSFANCHCNIQNKHGNTPLCVAAGTVHSDVVQFLVEIDDCDVNHQNKKGDTPLHIACRIGDIRVVRTLTDFRNRKLKVSCNFNVTNNQQETPVLIAFRNRHSAIFRLLVTAHSYDNLFSVLESVNKDLWPEVVKLLTSDGMITVSPQFESQFDVIHFLFNKKVWDLNGLDHCGNTPLHIACLAGDLNVVRIITDFTNCHNNVKNNQQETPALIAYKRHHNDIFSLLVTEDHCERLLTVLETIKKDQWFEAVSILITGKYGSKVVTMPLFFGSKLEVISFLAEEKIWNMDDPIKHGNTLLHFLCQYSENLTLFIDKDDAVKAVNCHNSAGNTPLHLACLAGNVNAVQFLTNIPDCKADVKNNQQETPALIAFNKQHKDIFRLIVTEHRYKCLLIVLGNINKKQWPKVVMVLSLDRTIVVPSHFKSQLDVLHFLFKKGVWNLNCLDDFGNTPLHIACLANHLDCVRFFTSEVGCDINAQNHSGKTPLLIAFQKNFDDIYVLLIAKQPFEYLLNVLAEMISKGQWPNLVRIWSTYRRDLLAEEDVWNPNRLDKYGNTVLHTACSNYPTYLVEGLVELGCDVNFRNANGDTPLHIACKESKYYAVVYLISRPECDINCQNLTGNTPLHLACQLCTEDILQLILTHKKCFVDVQNHDGDTPLCLACQSSDQFIINYLISTNKCNINHQNKDGNSPLHIACRDGKLAIVRVLLMNGCEIALRNKQREVPALVAFNHQQPDALKLLVTEKHCESLVHLLDMVGRDKWPDLINILIDNTKLSSLPNFLSPQDIIKFLVQMQIWSSLHHACHCGYAGLVKYLLNDQNIVLGDSNGNTPLHHACLQGHLEVVKFILNTNSCVKAKTSCILDVPNNQGDTPLHLACSRGHLQVVKLLISSGLFDPTVCNTVGIIPVELAKTYPVIKEFVSQYASFKSSNPLWHNTKVCVVGNHSSGKTTLVEVLQREAAFWRKFVPIRFNTVSNVESCTCGIIPVHLRSKKFGNVILYDFAGHIEYYSSHAAVLENFRSSSPPPLFIILIKLVDSEEEIVKQLYYWTSMIENHCKTTKNIPKVIVVGSFADKVKDLLPQKTKHVKQLLGLVVEDSLLSMLVLQSCFLQFVGFVALDCRILASQGIDTLCTLLADNCHALQKVADTSFGCHVLYALLSDKFNDKVAYTVSEIIEGIHSDDAHEDLLPHDTGSLVHLLKTLSDYGEILLLLNQENPQNSWVILDKSVLLSEINGTVFAPEHFERRYKGFLMSTGVVPLSKIREAFPKYNTEMITSFLTYLEFCQEVKDPDALGGITATHLQLTQSTTPSAVTERYFFFPALVNLEKPTDVWKDNESMQYNCGWLLQCIKPDKFLTSRFMHVLLLRLAFSYALTPESHHYPEDPSYPVLRKRCSVWKNGIQWFSRAGGIETIVEVREQTKLVAILMRCVTKADIECAKLRSSVIEKVLSVQKEFCPTVSPMAECLIHPNDVQYPLPSTEQLKLFSHKEIAELVIANPEENEQFAIGEIPSSIMNAQQLLSFEPYLGLGEALVQQLFSDKDADKTVSENVLDKLAEHVFQRMPQFKKMLNTPENKFAECHGQAQVRQCCYLFKLWSQQRDKATYKLLRKEFDRYSIFHGRNPLVSFHYSLILLLVHNFVDKQ